MTTTTMARCEGCDSEQPHVAEYEAKFSDGAGWQRVQYCPECAELAEANFNGETLAIRCPVCSPVNGEDVTPSNCSSLTHVTH